MMISFMILLYWYVLDDPGADVNWMDENKQGLSAIHLATLGGHSHVVESLIQAKGDVNVKDR